MEFLSAPSNGFCGIISDSDGCVDPLSPVLVKCEGYEVECFGESSTLTTQLFVVSDSGNLVPLSAPSASLENEFLVANDETEIKVQICNSAVCTMTGFIPISICDKSDEELEEAIEIILENVEENIAEDNLEITLESLLAIGNSLEDCESYFDEVIRLTEEYIGRLVTDDKTATYVPDTTTLMELLAIIGARSCSAPVELFESLLMLCNAPTTAEVQTYALDELLSTIVENAKTDDDRISAIDFALQVNECIQGSSLSERCSDRLPTLFDGDSFYYAQYIITMREFKEEEVRIDIPKATIIFPKGFDRQIAKDYSLATGDTTVPFSCVGINLARTDEILGTNVTIDSAIIGMTANVFVNGSAFTIELGHQGEPVEDVILRIYRQSTQEDKKRKKKDNQKHFSKRLQLEDEDDCDETIDCSYYEGEGLLSPSGCETIQVTDEYVDCSCDHYSNFGLLFFSCDSEDWTIWRILSISLLGFIWITLLVLIGLVVWSRTFRRFSGTETLIEKKERVLGKKGSSKPRNPTIE